jgi:peptidoglycan/xylan/chitin deacetylase (PgdA/CDA1 family)
VGPVRWLVLGVGTLALGCTERAPAATHDRVTPAIAPAPAPYVARPQIGGRAFPDRTLALTWDDGPDADTLALARYLHGEGVAGTFFVVAAWVPGVSSDPGSGNHVFETGYDAMPVLAELVKLGHRIGNHTKNHVLLPGSSAAVVVQQLGDNQEKIEPLQGGAPRIFRVPGGAWDEATSRAVDSDPVLRRLVGPVRWDIDAKDWDGSISCTSANPALECEPAGPGGASRVKPRVMAERYLTGINALGHGIVLLHDRVGHVGSHYAVDLAKTLIPELKARGYVFTTSLE